MKKIFHISGTTIPGGGPEHIFQLIKRLNQNEWEVVICTLKDGLYWEKFKSLNIKTYNLALRIISLKTACKFFLILRKETRLWTFFSHLIQYWAVPQISNFPPVFQKESVG